MKKKLKEIVTQIRGVSYKPTDIKSEIDGIPILRANNIQDDGINLDELVYIDSKKVHEEQYLKKGDIVICASSGSKNLVGKAATYNKNEKSSFGAFCKVVRVNESENLCKEFVQQYFQSKLYRNAISELSIGANINNIKTEHIDALEINVPSLPEQQKIAAYLDSIQRAIDNKKQQLQQLDELVKSKFVEMFGDVKEQASIKEICDVSGGYSFKSGDISENSGIRILQIGNVALNDVSWEVTNYLPKDFEKKHESFLLKKDDIVMALTRPIIQSLGNVKTCLVKSTDLPCLLNQRVGKIRAKFGTNIRFVYYCFMQHSFTDYVQSCCKGSSQPNMSTKDIENYEIPKVDENLQNTFAEYVQKIDSAKSIIKTQLVDLQELLDSKMDEYFGE